MACGTCDSGKLDLSGIRFEAPTATQPTTARDPLSNQFILKTGLLDSPILFVDTIAVTPEVAAGGVVDVEVIVTNAATGVTQNDPDICQAGSSNGFEYDITADPSWTSAETVTDCTGPGSVGSNKYSYTFSFTAPASGGVETLDVSVQGATSGVGGSKSYSVSVSEDSDQQRPGTGDPDGEEKGDTTQPDSPGGGFLGGLNVTSGLVILVLVLLLLLVIGVSI